MSRLVARAPCPNGISNVSAAKFDLGVVTHDLIGVRWKLGRERYQGVNASKRTYGEPYMVVALFLDVLYISCKCSSYYPI